MQQKENETITIAFEDLDAFQTLCGQFDENLKRLEANLRVGLRVRGNEVTVSGSEQDVAKAKTLLKELYEVAKRGAPVGVQEVDRALAVVAVEPGASLSEIMSGGIKLPGAETVVIPKTPNQKAYLDAMAKNDVVLAIGPAGTGKTYLAMAFALWCLFGKKVKHIVLTRPAVEAGERLGFLPGDMVEKVNPYLRPLYDALYDIMGYERGGGLVGKGVIEIAPLAFMRGRTLSNCFIILDEAQNCSVEQMKMLLTRIGYNSRVVVTGDVTQTDLPAGKISGLSHARQILAKIKGVAVCEFDERDVMRHPVVAEILKAYDAYERRTKKR
jgi:phosphate starvation-inducible PhoH-like protein